MMSATLKDKEAADKAAEIEERRAARRKMIQARAERLADFDPFEFAHAHKRASGFRPGGMKSSEFRVRSWAAAAVIGLLSSVVSAQVPGAPGAPTPAPVKAEAPDSPVVKTMLDLALATLTADARAGYLAARAQSPADRCLALRTWLARNDVTRWSRAVLELDLADAMTAEAQQWQSAGDDAGRKLGAAQRLAMTLALRDAEIVLQLLRPRAGAWPEVMTGIEERLKRIAALRGAVAAAK